MPWPGFGIEPRPTVPFLWSYLEKHIAELRDV
jgi:hypothetical protein